MPTKHQPADINDILNGPKPLMGGVMVSLDKNTRHVVQLPIAQARAVNKLTARFGQKSILRKQSPKHR